MVTQQPQPMIDAIVFDFENVVAGAGFDPATHFLEENLYLKWLLDQIGSDISLYVLMDTSLASWEVAKTLSTMKQYFPDPHRHIPSFEEAILRTGSSPDRILYVSNAQYYANEVSRREGRTIVYDCSYEPIVRVRDEIDKLGGLKEGRLSVLQNH